MVTMPLDSDANWNDKASGTGLRSPSCAVQERPAKHPAEVVRVVQPQRQRVLARAQLRLQIDIPLELVVAEPPQARQWSMGNQRAVDVQPALVEEPGEPQPHVARGLV